MPPKIRERRNQLELNLVELRAEKAKLSDAEYFTRLERLLVELARLYDRADQPNEKDAEGDAKNQSVDSASTQ